MIKFSIKLITSTVILLLTISTNIKSQQADNIPDLKAQLAKCDSIRKNTNFFTYNYKYLDDDYNIIIDTKTYKKTIKKYAFYEDRIKDYDDSLGVVMMAEFNDWDMARIANFRIGYTWLRLGYHTWQTKEEAKAFAKKFGITHPWKMREFLMDDHNNNPQIISFFNDLKAKIKSQNTKDNIEELNRDKLLTAALRCNPQRIADYKIMVAERRKQREAFQK